MRGGEGAIKKSSNGAVRLISLADLDTNEIAMGGGEAEDPI